MSLATDLTQFVADITADPAYPEVEIQEISGIHIQFHDPTPGVVHPKHPGHIYEGSDIITQTSDRLQAVIRVQSSGDHRHLFEDEIEEGWNVLVVAYPSVAAAIRWTIMKFEPVLSEIEIA